MKLLIQCDGLRLIGAESEINLTVSLIRRRPSDQGDRQIRETFRSNKNIHGNSYN